MCHENNHRCAGQVQYMQNVSLAVELKRRAKEAQRRMAGTSELGRGIDAGMEMLIMWIEELAPVKPAE